MKGILIKMNIKKLIFGLSLGDGYLTKPKSDTANSRLVIKHSAKQIEYLIYKKNLLENNGLICSMDAYTDKNGYSVVQLRTSKTRVIKEIQEKLYLNGKKEISEELMELYFDPFILSILFQDDGSREMAKWHRSNGTKYGVEPYINNFIIHTCNFSYVSNSLLQKKMEEMNIESRIIKRRKYDVIIVSKKEAKKEFVKTIKPYFCQSMLYKINSPLCFQKRL